MRNVLDIKQWKFTQIFLIFGFVFTRINGFENPKYSCEYGHSDSGCHDKFAELSSNPSTKTVFIHLNHNGRNFSTDDDKDVNPVFEKVWVRKSAARFLTYPDDFHALTFGLIYDNVYEMDIEISYTSIHTNFSSSNTSIYFVYTALLSNISNGLLCHRDTNNDGLEYLSLYLTWIGYNYVCFSYDNGYMKEQYISKITTPMVLILVLCAIAMLWFPVVFTFTDQNKIQLSRQNTSNSAEQSASYDRGRTDISENMREQLNGLLGADHSRYDDAHLDLYDQGDVPYGCQRFLFHIYSHTSMQYIHRKRLPSLSQTVDLYLWWRLRCWPSASFLYNMKMPIYSPI